MKNPNVRISINTDVKNTTKNNVNLFENSCVFLPCVKQ